jgi:hypothetical protein
MREILREHGAALRLGLVDGASEAKAARELKFDDEDLLRPWLRFHPIHTAGRPISCTDARPASTR